MVIFSDLMFIQLHVQGKTQEAKADLSRLAKIRAERDAAQAKRKAETDGVLSHPPRQSLF
jgi:Casein kinase substrate phosphoprotein PP28